MIAFFEQQLKWYFGTMTGVFLVFCGLTAVQQYHFWTLSRLPFVKYAFTFVAPCILLVLVLVTERIVRKRRPTLLRLITEACCAYGAFFLISAWG